MDRFFRYYSSLQGVGSSLLGLPHWALTVLGLLALPGILLLLLSILGVLASLAALLLLTVPAYRLLKTITGRVASSSGMSPMVVGESVVIDSPGRRHVDVKIIE